MIKRNKNKYFIAVDKKSETKKDEENNNIKNVPQH